MKNQRDMPIGHGICPLNANLIGAALTNALPCRRTVSVCAVLKRAKRGCFSYFALTVRKQKPRSLRLADKCSAGEGNAFLLVSSNSGSYKPWLDARFLRSITCSLNLNPSVRQPGGDPARCRGSQRCPSISHGVHYVLKLTT